jgi:hypothetical protein
MTDAVEKAVDDLTKLFSGDTSELNAASNGLDAN